MHRIFSSKHIESWIQSHDLIICWLNGTGGRFSKCFCIFIGDLHIECIITFSLVKNSTKLQFCEGCSFSERHIIKTVIKNDLFQLAQIVTHPAIDLSLDFLSNTLPGKIADQELSTLKSDSGLPWHFFLQLCFDFLFSGTFRAKLTQPRKTLKSLMRLSQYESWEYQLIAKENVNRRKARNIVKLHNGNFKFSTFSKRG